jgi:class 3 adenylate cyclase
MLVDLTQSVTRGDLSRRIPEDRWDEIGRLARAFNTMVKGLSERERMRDLFGRYLSREVSEAVLAGAVRLGGERKVVSVIFADMRGSTSFAEGQAPEAVMLALNQYFEIIINATEANGGILARFLGDGALCIFGAPRELADHADCAVRATLAMRAGLSELNHWRAGRGLPILRFGIGINSGEVTAGATGSEQRQEYTIIGDAVNLASRIEEQTKQHPDYDILLSEFTHRALGPRARRYRCAELGSFAIRGRSQPVVIFGLLGDVAGTQGVPAAPPASAIRAEE